MGNMCMSSTGVDHVELHASMKSHQGTPHHVDDHPDITPQPSVCPRPRSGTSDSCWPRTITPRRRQTPPLPV